MNLPANTSLPFFAYGIFRKGQISYICIEDAVEEVIPDCEIEGQLRLRDGIPIIDNTIKNESVVGDVIRFKENKEQSAYKNITALEPEKHYVWATATTTFGLVNVLYGRSPKKGSTYAEQGWDCWEDPLFTTTFEIIDDELANDDIDISGKQFLRLQMAYMLLWTAIERFVALRYIMGSGDNVMKKINQLANNEVYVTCLKSCSNKERRIYSSADASSDEKFDITNPLACLHYYYQIRSNITHRGKATISDAKLVRQCLEELTIIFKKVLIAAKNEAEI